MPRQNPNLVGSAASLQTAASAIRAAVTGGSFEDLKAALVAAAGAFEQAQDAISRVELRLRDLGEANPIDPRRPAGLLVSGDRIRGGVQVQGGLASVAGQGMDLTFETQVSHVKSYDHGANTYRELDIDGSAIVINSHGGTISLTGTISLSTPLPVAQGGTGTATGSITGTGDLTFTAGGSNKTVALVSSGTGKVTAKPGTNSVTAIQLQNAAGTAVVNVDTTNGKVGIGTTAPSSPLHVVGAAAPQAVIENTGGNARLDIKRLGATDVAQLLFNTNGTLDYQIGEFSDSNLQIRSIANVANGITLVGSTGAVGVGTTSPTVSGTGLVHFAGNTARVVDAGRTPANSADTGNDGEVCVDSGFIYIHTGGSWRRVAVATF